MWSRSGLTPDHFWYHREESDARAFMGAERMNDMMLKLAFNSTHISNPREFCEMQPDGTFLMILVVDCDLPVRSESGPGTPMAAVIDELRQTMIEGPYDRVTIEPKVK